MFWSRKDITSVTYFGHRIDEYVWDTSNCRNGMRQAGMQAGSQAVSRQAGMQKDRIGVGHASRQACMEACRKALTKLLMLSCCASEYGIYRSSVET